MNEHTDSDLQAELAALQQRLSDLEAEHRELKRQATRTRCPAFFRKFLLGALPVALLLAAAGVLYAVDAFFIDQNGNATFSGNVAIGTGSLTAQTVNVATINGTQGGKVKVEGDLEVTGKLNNNESLRFLWGTVDGQKKDGLGFTAGKPIPNAVGLYYVSFGARFTSMPAGSVTAFNENEKGDHSAIITRLAETGMWVQTTNRSGQPEERKFSFLVIGPR